MAEQDKKPASFEELLVGTLAMADAVTKIVDRKRRVCQSGLISGSWNNAQRTSGF
jgi:hypothetical protein